MLMTITMLSVTMRRMRDDAGGDEEEKGRR